MVHVNLCNLLSICILKIETNTYQEFFVTKTPKLPSAERRCPETEEIDIYLHNMMQFKRDRESILIQEPGLFSVCMQ